MILFFKIFVWTLYGLGAISIGYNEYDYIRQFWKKSTIAEKIDEVGIIALVIIVFIALSIFIKCMFKLI